MHTGKQAQGPKKAKVFVLDTNVILHDHKAIHKFQDNDVVIPIAVIEELDKFKKGNDTLAFNARGFVRDLDRLLQGRDGREGVSLGKGRGNIRIELSHPFPDRLRSAFQDDIPDHRIIATAMWVRDNTPGRFVALVTKDINMRLKAKAVGMEVQDYLTDKLDDETVEFTKREVIISENADPAVLQKLTYGPEGGVPWKDLCREQPSANQLFKFFWPGAQSATLARYDARQDRIVLVRRREAAGISPRNDEQALALDACLNPDIRLVSLTGGAGTGKTLLALAAAIEQERDYAQIIISRPAITLGNQDIGFLPGNEKSKMGPFVQPLLDNLDVIKNRFKPGSRQYQHIEAMLTEEKVLISPLAYIRGRSLGRVFFIIDEAQNLTPHEIKTIVTRAGEDTKIVFTGDIFQIDQPYLDQWSNGLAHIGQKLTGQKLFEHVNLHRGERSELSEIAAKLL